MRLTCRNLIGGAFGATVIAMLAASSVQAADGFHAASQSEIEAYVAKSITLTKLSNGWSYGSSAKYGYQFSNGAMCVRSQSGSISCTKIVTDGTKFYTVAPDGTKTPFSANG